MIPNRPPLCCQQLRQEAWKIHWMRRAGRRGAGEEHPSDCDCTPPWPTRPPTTHYKLHPWSNTVNCCKKIRYQSFKDWGTWDPGPAKRRHEKPLKQCSSVNNQWSVDISSLEWHLAATVIWIMPHWFHFQQANTSQSLSCLYSLQQLQHSYHFSQILLYDEPIMLWKVLAAEYLGFCLQSYVP